MKNPMKIWKFTLLCSLFLLNACDTGYPRMQAGEYGVVFSALPRWGVLGPMRGGVEKSAIVPLEREIIWPWEELARVDTTLQTIGWGGRGEGTEKTKPDYVETRTVDGNEVGLSVEVHYRVNPEMVAHVVQKVGGWDDDKRKRRIEALISSVARADIRTHMNVLTTRDFFTETKRQEAINNVKRAMQARLQPEGIIVERVKYINHEFERAGAPGQAPDRSYQEQIDETQQKIQETEQEAKKRAALIQQKGQEYEKMEGERKRILNLVKGYARQAKLRGDAYLTSKENEAEQIRVSGLNEVEGMKQRIAALSGPGGEALLRLEIAQALAKRRPSFVLMNSSKNSNAGLDFNKVDTNELIRQAGLFAGISEGAKARSEAEEAQQSSIVSEPPPPPKPQQVEIPEPARAKR